jgi:hypothetical protein
MILVPAALAALLVFATSSRVEAYGAYHGGTTTYGAGGVQHYGSTAAAGPYGAGTVTHSGTTTPYQHSGVTTATGAGGSSYSVVNTRTYSPSTYGGYSPVTTVPQYNTTGVTRVN